MADSLCHRMYMEEDNDSFSSLGDLLCPKFFFSYSKARGQMSSRLSCSDWNVFVYKRQVNNMFLISFVKQAVSIPIVTVQ